VGFVEVRAGYNLDVVAPGYVLDLSRPCRSADPRAGPAQDSVIESGIRERAGLAVAPVERSAAQRHDGTRVARLVARLAQLRPGRALGASSYAGYTSENPKFEAWWLGTTLEFELARHCTLVTELHYYQRHGRSARSARADQRRTGSAQLRRQPCARFSWSRVTLKLSIGPYFTDYETGHRFVPGVHEPLQGP